MAENINQQNLDPGQPSTSKATNKIQVGRYLSRLRNPAVVMGLAGYALTICSVLGLKVDNEAVYGVLQAISGIFILLGIMNNPDEKGCDLPKIKTKI